MLGRHSSWGFTTGGTSMVILMGSQIGGGMGPSISADPDHPSTHTAAMAVGGRSRRRARTVNAVVCVFVGVTRQRNALGRPNVRPLKVDSGVEV